MGYDELELLADGIWPLHRLPLPDGRVLVIDLGKSLQEQFSGADLEHAKRRMEELYPPDSKATIPPAARSVGHL